MSVLVEISIGDFLDKLSILKIKMEKISDQNKRHNIKKEHDLYLAKLDQAQHSKQDVDAILEKLLEVNLALWEIEDEIRAKERNQQFDEGFIELARSVYKTNDLRAKIKRHANESLGSRLVEEKSYQGY
ncbi:MAG: hypothetical protein HKN08_05345 [Gammaproteobacteria bacterium]|nr:hypothetical protein [Gammaproteobacteria bacterium]